MVGYEYKIIPAPAKGLKAPGVKGPEARFANALELRINELASEGWEYQRADILPSEERQGITSTHTVYRSVLVFRRALAADVQDEAPLPENTAGGEAEHTEPDEQDHNSDAGDGAEDETTPDEAEEEKKSE
ncbi:DUF4177 domain-containing protein [uncultured Roseovarius sp.]|uniref:DUF4177 domain-containing protein n=1 Tax=uncultured Roseovarius sp. TaxID=293344 RepID=UPI002633E267|nr:DUF4177 domain-containing protein [uncultured Roseovarius sp.]